MLKYNKHISRFHSWFCSPGREDIDIFTVDWSGEDSWCIPLYTYFVTPLLLHQTVRQRMRHVEVCPILAHYLRRW